MRVEQPCWALVRCQLLRRVSKQSIYKDIIHTASPEAEHLNVQRVWLSFRQAFSLERGFAHAGRSHSAKLNNSKNVTPVLPKISKAVKGVIAVCIPVHNASVPLRLALQRDICQHMLA